MRVEVLRFGRQLPIRTREQQLVRDERVELAHVGGELCSAEPGLQSNDLGVRGADEYARHSRGVYAPDSRARHQPFFNSIRPAPVVSRSVDPPLPIVPRMWCASSRPTTLMSKSDSSGPLPLVASTRPL